MRVPLYLSKFSNHLYSVHDHLLFLAVRELEKETWRGLHDRLADSKAVEAILHRSRIPHFTTPQKFLQRVPHRWLARLLVLLTSLLTSRLYLAADASGFSLRAASTHYLQRLGKPTEVRDVLKSLDLVDVRTGLIVATRALPGHRHEAPHLVPTLRAVPFEIPELYADKGFDSEAIHLYLKERGTEGYIPPRGPEAPRSFLRRQVWAYREEDPARWRAHYGRRSFVESTYHALKARVGERVAGRNRRRQERYHWAKVWAYDLRLFARRSRVHEGHHFDSARIGFLLTLPRERFRRSTPGLAGTGGFQRSAARLGTEPRAPTAVLSSP